jgi:hypothetical protein
MHPKSECGSKGQMNLEKDTVNNNQRMSKRKKIRMMLIESGTR